MKRAILVPLGFWFMYVELRDGLDYCLPGVGYAGEHGYLWVQYAFLTLIGMGLFGAVFFGYRFLSDILD